jgi:GNAT superfamily N-acetyltransferase
MVASELSVRNYREGDEAQILELYRVVHGRSMSQAHWKWLFMDNPAGRALICVTEAHGRIVSHQATWPRILKVGEEYVKSHTGGQAMTHPDYRRQGLWELAHRKLLEELANEGIPFRYGPTQNVRSYPGAIKLGFFDICVIPSMRKVLNWGKILGSRTRMGFLGNIWTDLMLGTYPKVRVHSDLRDIEVNRVSSFDNGIDEFWTKVSHNARVMGVRDRKYLNWRYVDRPGYDYAIYLARRQEEILGYIVLCHREEDLVRGYILDLLTLPGQDSIAQLLINKAIEHFRRQKADTIRCWMLKHISYYNIIRKMGFASVGTKLPAHIMVYTLTDKVKPEFLKDPSNWFYSMGDEDDGV